MWGIPNILHSPFYDGELSRCTVRLWSPLSVGSKSSLLQPFYSWKGPLTDRTTSHPYKVLKDTLFSTTNFNSPYCPPLFGILSTKVPYPLFTGSLRPEGLQSQIQSVFPFIEPLYSSPLELTTTFFPFHFSYVRRSRWELRSVNFIPLLPHLEYILRISNPWGEPGSL